MSMNLVIDEEEDLIANAGYPELIVWPAKTEAQRSTKVKACAT